MRDRRDPWKWPVTWAATIGLLWSVVFVVPAAWYDLLVARRAPLEVPHSRPPREFLLILPPPVLSIESDRTREEPEVPETQPEDPRWWTRGWAVAGRQDRALFRAPTTSATDTTALVLEALGMGVDFLTRARPDSVMAHRLFLLRLEDGFRYDELKPYLTGLARSRDYADILARAADMYDEHLAREILVPD